MRIGSKLGQALGIAFVGWISTVWVTARADNQPLQNPGQSSLKIFTLDLHHATSNEVLSLLGWNRSDRLSLPRGVDTIQAGPKGASLVIRSTPEAYANVRGIVDQLDIAPKQVVLEVDFITLTNEAINAVANEWPPMEGLALKKELACRGSDTKVAVLTNNNVPATIELADVAGTPGSGSRHALRIVPRINQDGTVSLVIAPFDESQRPQPEAVPQINSSSVEIIRTARSGEATACWLPAQLANRSHDPLSRRIRVLSDLPLIGSAFRSRNRTISDSTLIIYVTPTMVDDSKPKP